MCVKLPSKLRGALSRFTPPFGDIRGSARWVDRRERLHILDFERLAA